MTAILERPVLTDIRPIARPRRSRPVAAAILDPTLTTAEYNRALAAYTRVAQPQAM